MVRALQMLDDWCRKRSVCERESESVVAASRSVDRWEGGEVGMQAAVQ